MKRRGFFKLLGLAPLAAVTAVEVETSTKLVINGWLITWTGWKRMGDQNVLVGQWTADPRDGDGMSLYASCPGGQGAFYGDMLFDISIRDGQPVCHANASLEEKAAAKSEGLDRLHTLIERAGPPPLFYHDALNKKIY